MKRNAGRFLLVFSLLFAFCVSASPVKLDVCYDVFPPWFMDPKNPEYPGYAVELVRQFLPPEEFTLSWKRMEWSRAVCDFQSGKLGRNCMFLAVHPADVSAGKVSEDPLFVVESAVFVRASDRTITVREGDIFPEGRAAMPSDWSVSDAWDAALAERAGKGALRFFPLRTAAEKSVPLLLNGKIRFLIGDPSAIRYTLLRMKKDPGVLVLWKDSGVRVPFHAAFPKDSAPAARAEKAMRQRYKKWLLTEQAGKLRRKYGLDLPGDKGRNKPGKER